MDDIDKDILNILQKNDKISYKKIGTELDLAASTVHNRIKNLKKSGLIKSFSAIIDTEKAGFKTIAWIGLSVEPIKMRFVAERLESLEEVQTVAITSGDHDMVIQVIANDEKELWRFINSKIKIISGIKPRMEVTSFIELFKFTHVIKFH